MISAEVLVAAYILIFACPSHFHINDLDPNKNHEVVPTTKLFWFWQNHGLTYLKSKNSIKFFSQERITKNDEKYYQNALHILNKMYLQVFLLDVLVPISISTSLPTICIRQFR